MGSSAKSSGVKTGMGTDGGSVDGIVFRRAGRDVAGQECIRVNRPFGPWDAYC